jgi:hypothetical protein
VKMNPCAESLVAYARSIEGEELLTPARQRQFCVSAIGNDLEFTPGTSHTPRLENRARIAAVLERFVKTRSFRTAEYASISFNASCVLGLIRHWQASQM